MGPELDDMITLMLAVDSIAGARISWSGLLQVFICIWPSNYCSAGHGNPACAPKARILESCQQQERHRTPASCCLGLEQHGFN